MAAQAHLFVLFGVFVLLKAVAYWDDRYGIDFSQRGAVTTGASYTDVNAVLPAKTVLAVIAILCALLFFAGAARRSAMLPASVSGCSCCRPSSSAVSTRPIIQQFVVKPNELAKETPFIQREIETTRQAYGITASTVRVSPYSAISTESQTSMASQVPGRPDAAPGSRRGVADLPAAAAGQEVLPVRRHAGHGPVPAARWGPLPQDTVIAVRGMAGPPPGQGNWINTHLVYTHGFGVVAAHANDVQGNGNPASWRGTSRRTATSA